MSPSIVRYRSLDLNLLVSLEALLTEKSVTRAAERLHVSQSTMSGALARLREYFGDQLAVQIGRELEFTPLAKSLAGPIHNAILTIDSVLNHELQFDPAHGRRHFTISVSDYVVNVLLVDFLKRIKRLAPGVTFEFRQSAGRLRQELESGEVDFVIGPEIDVVPEHPQETLFQDNYIVVAWRGNTSIGDALTFDDWVGLGHVVFRTRPHGLPWLDRWLARRYGDARRIDVTAQSFSVLPQLVIGTSRIATVPLRLACLCAQSLPIRLIPAPVELPTLTEVMQWHVHRDQDLASRWLRSELAMQTALLPPAR